MVLYDIADTGLPQFRLGFGCSGAWGMDWFSEKQAIELIHQAINLGIRDFDTGNFYCNGNAERRLGLALRDCAVKDRTALRISSKTGTQMAHSGWPDYLSRQFSGTGRLYKDFSADTIRRDIETSLERLGIDTLDVFYLHGPNEHELFSSLPVLQTLNHEGLIHATGVCSEGPHLALAAAQPEVSAIMGVYNLFRREHEGIFRNAKTAGKQVTAIAPLAQGLYRKALFLPKSLPDLWHLTRALVKNRPELAQAQQARWLHEQDGWQAAELALAFVIANQDIDLAITTTTNPEHLAASITAAAREFPDEVLTQLESAASDTAPAPDA